MSESYTVVLSPQAIEDLRSIYSYIAYELQVPNIAQEQINRIRNGIRALDFLPFRYPIVNWEPWHSEQTHQFSIDIMRRFSFDQRCSTVVSGGNRFEIRISSKPAQVHIVALRNEELYQRPIAVLGGPHQQGFSGPVRLVAICITYDHF